MIKLTFVVRNAPTQMGQALYLVGNKSCLGDWQVSAPLPLIAHSFSAGRQSLAAETKQHAGAIIAVA